MTSTGLFRHAAAVTALALSLPAAAAAAQQERAVFDLSLRGISAGRLTVEGKVEGNRYSATGTLQSGGILGALKKVRYDAAVLGGISGSRFSPARYTEQADTGKRQSEVVMTYKAGVPGVETYKPPRQPRDYDIDPARQQGTVDPMTALFAVLRDTPAADACTARLVLFDGRRRTQVALAPAGTKGDKITCAGEYRRLEGFSPDDMQEKTRFPFTLTYAPAGNGTLRVVEVSMDTLYGKGALKRR
jgi:hypothetical protein